MTRNEIVNEAVLQLEAYGMLVENTGGANFHFAWGRMLDMVLDEYTNPFSVNFKEATTSIISGQDIYCPPEFKRIDMVLAQLADGTWRELHPGDTGLLKTVYPNAYTDPQSGNPTHYISQGLNRTQLYPVPDYAATDGLLWMGWGPLLREDWPNLSSNCPLQRRYQPHLISGLCYRMAAANPPLREFFQNDFLRFQAVYNTDVNAYTRWVKMRTGYGYPDGARIISEDPFNG